MAAVIPDIPAMDVHPDAGLTDNLTGGQIQEVLDTLIIEAVSPIILGSDAFDLQIAHLLSATARNRKRKLSSLPRDVAMDAMCQYLSTSDRELKVKLLKSMRLERGFIYNFVVRFLDECEDYQRMYREWLMTRNKAKRRERRHRLTAVERSVGATNCNLFQIISSSRDYLELAYRFRNTIVMNYVRHAYKQAKMFVKSKGPNYDFKDVHQNFLAAVTKAVDKYDASRGALTSYINWWLLNAQTTSNSLHGHEYGIAYTIPQLQKKSLASKSRKAKHVNFGVSLDKMVGSEDDRKELVQFIAGDQSVEQEILNDEELDTIRGLVKHADHKGIARLYLDIEEVFSKKEKRKMLKTMRAQLGVVPVRDGEGTVQFAEVKTLEATPPKVQESAYTKDNSPSPTQSDEATSVKPKKPKALSWRSARRQKQRRSAGTL